MVTLLLFIYLFFLKRRVTTPTCGYLNSSVFFEGSNEEIGNNFNWASFKITTGNYKQILSYVRISICVYRHEIWEQTY